MNKNIAHTHNFILTEQRTEPSLLRFVRWQGVYFIPPAHNHSQDALIGNNKVDRKEGHYAFNSEVTTPDNNPQTKQDILSVKDKGFLGFKEQSSGKFGEFPDKNVDTSCLQEKTYGVVAENNRNSVNDNPVWRNNLVDMASEECGNCNSSEAVIIFADAEKTPTEKVTPFSNIRCILVTRHSQNLFEKTSFFQTIFSPVCICEKKQNGDNN